MCMCLSTPPPLSISSDFEFSIETTLSMIRTLISLSINQNSDIPCCPNITHPIHRQSLHSLHICITTAISSIAYQIYLLPLLAFQLPTIFNRLLPLLVRPQSVGLSLFAFTVPISPRSLSIVLLRCLVSHFVCFAVS